MYDEVGDPKQWHPCEHRKVEFGASDGYIGWTQQFPGMPSTQGADTVFQSPMGYGYGCARSTAAERWSPSFPALSDMASQAAAELSNMLQESGRTQAHAISFARELAETISMLKHPFKVVEFVGKYAHPSITRRLNKTGVSRSSLREAFRSAHSRKLGKPLSAASDTWLEGTYGWNPFVTDMIAIYHAAVGAALSRRELAKVKPDPVVITKTHRDSALAVPRANAYLDGYYALLRSGAATLDQSYALHTTVAVNPSVQAESALTSVARSLNIDRLGYAVWDAVPYSFVVDWFLPMGEALDRALSGPTFYVISGPIWAIMKEKRVTTCSWYGNNLMNFGRYPIDTRHNGGASYSETSRYFSRQKIEYSDLMLTNPTGMHGTRIASGAALSLGVLERWHR